MVPQVSPRRAWAVLVALSLAAFAFITTELLPVGLLTHIAPDLDRSRSQVGLLVSGYAIVVVLASVPLARLTQRIPRRQLLGVTMLLFAAANALAALASTYAVLAGSRVVTALAQALFWSIATATVTGPFPAAVRGRVVALFATGATLAPVLGVPSAPGSGSRPVGVRRSGRWPESDWRSPSRCSSSFPLIPRLPAAPPVAPHPTGGASSSCWSRPPSASAAS